MHKDTLAQLVEEGLTQRQIAQTLGVSQTTIRYWLNKFELTTRKKYQCRHCGETRKSKFSAGRFTSCKKCRSRRQVDRYISYKQKAIEYKGGECIHCGYNKNIAALDFHHRDPQKKDPDWKLLRHRKFETILRELDKCDLVCKNCHAELHYPQCGV